MSDGNPVRMTASGPPETVLPPPEPALRHELARLPDAERRSVAARIVASHPRSPLAWAHLADSEIDVVAKYAAYRVGYHRGLDELRANGWRGSGWVKWTHEGNRGFLRCLAGLARTAAAIGEDDEAERCRLFLRQLDPSGIPEPE